MIFGSIGLLVVAGGLLAAGISESSTGFLVVSLLCTVAAGVLLLLAYATARGGIGVGSRGFAFARAGGAAPGPAVVYVPVAQSPDGMAQFFAVPAANGGVGGGAGAPVLGYDAMTADQVVRLVASGALGEEQLLAIRQYEHANTARKTVLDRVDRAIHSQQAL